MPHLNYAEPPKCIHQHDLRQHGIGTIQIERLENRAAMLFTNHEVLDGVEWSTQTNRSSLHHIWIKQRPSFGSIRVEKLRSHRARCRHPDHNLMLENIFLQYDSGAMDKIRQNADLYQGMQVVLSNNSGRYSNPCFAVRVDFDEPAKVRFFKREDFQIWPKFQRGFADDGDHESSGHRGNARDEMIAQIGIALDRKLPFHHMIVPFHVYGRNGPGSRQ